MSLSSQTQPLRFRVVPLSLAAAAQQPAAALKPFAPVLDSKEVELQFTVSLERVDFCFDGSKIPHLKSADWKPSHAIASWASWSRNKKTGNVVVTPDTPFACNEAAAVCCAGAVASALQAEWCDGTASAAKITKKLKLQPGGSAFDDHFIQITVFSAKQEYVKPEKPKDSSAPTPKPPTPKLPKQTCDAKSKPIALGSPLLLNLSEHVSVGSDGRVLDQAAPKSVSISLADCTLSFSIMYAATARGKPAVTTHEVAVKPSQFPKTCSFSVLADPPFTHSHLLGAHVRICSDPALLHIGSEFEICAADAADRFGQVVFCSQPSAAAAAGAAAVCTVHMKVDMVYLPCRPLAVHATLSEVYRVFVQGSPELASEVASRTAAAAAEHFGTRSSFVTDLKQRAMQGADAEVQLTHDELGAVLLRAGFLASQPLVSACVRVLIKKWYPDTYEDECARAFGSKEGPWDMFYIFDYLRKRNSCHSSSSRGSSNSFSKLLQELGYVGDAELVYNDRQQRLLEDIMDRIFAVRNWWAHVGVCIDDCAAALHAIAEFLDRVLKHVNVPDDSGLQKLKCIIESISISKFAAMKLTEDELAYLFLVRAFRRLSKISDGVMKTCAHSIFGKNLLARMKKKEAYFTRRQKSVMESVDVARSVLDIQGVSNRVRGDCMIIVSARNCFAHEAEHSSRVLAAVCAIGAVSRLLDFIYGHCKLDDEAYAMRSEADAAILEIKEYQAKLLARMGALEVAYLLEQLALSHEKEFAACQYFPLLSSNYAKAMLLLTMRIPLHLATSPASTGSAFTLSSDPTVAKCQRSLLRTVMLVPPSVQDARAAVAWLLSSPDPSLLGCSGLPLLLQAFKRDTDGSWIAEGSWIESIPRQSQDVLRKLCDAIEQVKKRVLEAEHAYHDACEKSEYARQKARAFESCSAPLGESNMRRLARIAKEFTGIKEVTDSVDKMCEAEKQFNLLHAEADSECVKADLLEAFRCVFASDSASDLNWEEMKQMCCHLLQKENRRETSGDPDHVIANFHSMFEPAALYEFSNIYCKKDSKTRSKLLFDVSIDILYPIFQVECLNPDVEIIEASLGSNYLHGMTMLAVLASHSLQKTLAPRSANPIIPLKVNFNRLATGINATIVADDKFIGREAEMARIDGRVRPLFETRSGCDKSIVLIRGQPGTGKSCLAKHQLCLVQNKFCVAEVSAVFSHCIPGRGSDGVRNALHRMGLDLRFRLGVDSAATVDFVLPLLKEFLSQNRFVLLVDDVDQSGLEELFRLVPGSSEGCCIVLTSQMEDIEETVTLMSNHYGFEFNSTKNGDSVHLECFSIENALALVHKICQGGDISTRLDAFKPYLPDIVAGNASSGLGLLPLGVRVFAEWLRQELLYNDRGNDDVLSAWESVCREVTMPDNPQPGHRGLRATVRLALKTLESRFTNNKDEFEACRQLLGMLSLCPPAFVPWSLFDGGTEREAHLWVRGAHVQVNGDSLEYVSPKGENCRFSRNAGESALHARVISDDITDNDTIQIEFEDGKIQSVAANNPRNLSFDEHICDRHHLKKVDHLKYVVRLQTPVPARGVQIAIQGHEDKTLNGKLARINFHFMSTKITNVLADKSSFSASLLGDDSRSSFPLETNYILSEPRKLPPGVKMQRSQLLRDATPLTPKQFTKTRGRVVQYHSGDDTVSVVFGCDTGELSVYKPGAELRRFHARDVSPLNVEGVVPSLQDSKKLRNVAMALKSVGLVDVDEERRMFGVHQLIQQAVGWELCRFEQCARMRRLLHARCGQFGDEEFVDVRLYGIMREVLEAAFATVVKMRAESHFQRATWCTGMLLRLYGVAQKVYGKESDFTKQVQESAHSSLIADLFFEYAISKSCPLDGKSLTLETIADAQHIRDVVEKYNDLNIRKLLAENWSLFTISALVRHLSHDFVNDGSKSSLEDIITAVTNLQLIKDILEMRTFDVSQCLKNFYEKSSEDRLVAEDVSCSVCARINVACMNDQKRLNLLNFDLKAMRWSFLTSQDGSEFAHKIVSEIQDANHSTEFMFLEGDNVEKWQIGVTLSAAYFSAAKWCVSNGATEDAIHFFEKALCIRMDLLGEYHPVTANTLLSFDKVSSCENDETFELDIENVIELKKRALRISSYVLGQHPNTACAMAKLADSYIERNDSQESKGRYLQLVIQKLYEEALKVHKNAVNWIHPDAAQMTFKIAQLYKDSNKLELSKQLAQEAYDMYTKMLGLGHHYTISVKNFLHSFVESSPHTKHFDMDERVLSWKSVVTTSTPERKCVKMSNDTVWEPIPFEGTRKIYTMSECTRSDAPYFCCRLFDIGATLKFFERPWEDVFGNFQSQGFYIWDVVIGSGAFQAGLQRRSQILEVDGVAVECHKYCRERLQRSLQGVKGSSVQMVVRIWNHRNKSLGREQQLRVKRCTEVWIDLNPLDQKAAVQREFHRESSKSVNVSMSSYAEKNTMEWTNRPKNGKGKFKFNDGLYDGEWSHGQRHGKGTMTFDNRDKFEGEWRMDMERGQGKYSFQNGHMLSGTFKFRNGNIYEGEFKNNKFNGKGRFTQDVDGVPIGSHYPGKKGDVYDGFWLDGKRHGVCTYTFHSTGDQRSFTWEDGECPEFREFVSFSKLKEMKGLLECQFY